MRYLTAITLLIVTLMLSGCGRKMPDGMPPLYPCKITVLQDGQPLSAAEVKLYPVERPAKDWSTAGITGQNGVIDLYTNGNYRGVPAGKYKVVVVKETTEDEGANYYYRMNTVDMQYSSSETTPLEIEVTKRGVSETANVGAAVKVRNSGRLQKPPGGDGGK
ncbi:MAG: hypothetical protein LBT46_14830 [Planctomycetaceae bacterium]|jgi:hypothetical protein|nr:hypothetical protein [Planctomycetaceae bacterium]